ncbi:MAG: putative baseplate assembly protein [bacterium]|nr:putative baseplate assembly protein [bacterium]
MSLPMPTLDERRFQDIVDEAKRLIPDYCPEWTDHNLSDPGIAMIELFAWMTEMIIYRLNHVPDVMYTRFLELMGIRLDPPAAARADLTFWLSAPQPEAVTIPAGTQVGTLRTEFDESIVFATDEDLKIVQPALTACLTSAPEGRYIDQWSQLRDPAAAVRCFDGPVANDAIFFGFEEGMPGNTLKLAVAAGIEGRGIDPDRPPLEWSAWDGVEWRPATVYEDGTSGLNGTGSIRLLLPPRHEPLTLGPARGYWVRCQLVARPDRPTYKESPEIQSVAATSEGGTVAAHHGEAVPAEMLGRSEGKQGQVFRLRRSPVLPRRSDEVVEVRLGDEIGRWTEVGDFAASSGDDRHYTLDGATGEVGFAPDIRYPDGKFVRHGAVPAMGSEIWVTGYRIGGGARGNVGARRLSVLKSSIPFIGSVENLAAAAGGVDAETVENAKLRGPMTLRAGERAVTTSDFERLTLEASREVARARCLGPEQPGDPVRVLIVPRLQVRPADLELDHLSLPEPVLAAVSNYLDERRILTTDVVVGTPSYQGVTAIARLQSAPGGDVELIRDAALARLYEYVNPLTGGPDGSGWPFDRSITSGEVFALLAGIEGVAGVAEVVFYPADLRTGEREDRRERIRLAPSQLFASFKHQVMVQ